MTKESLHQKLEKYVNSRNKFIEEHYETMSEQQRNMAVGALLEITNLHNYIINDIDPVNIFCY